MSGKKSSSQKKLSASVVRKRPVIMRSAPQKPYHLSPGQDHKRWGFDGLLSQLAVHAARWDGEDDEAADTSKMYLLS
jgi:hypothetical protein